MSGGLQHTSLSKKVLHLQAIREFEPLGTLTIAPNEGTPILSSDL